MSTSPDKVRVPKTAELVAHRIRSQIVRGEIKEGDNLPSEAELIEHFGVSRPTMREAFRILESERLISVSRGSRGGARVSAPNVDVAALYAGLYLQYRNTTMSDIYQALRIIEPAAARLLAIKHTAKDIKQLREGLQKERELLEDAEGFMIQNVQLSMMMVDMAGNDTIALMFHIIQGMVEAHFRALLGRKEDKDIALRRKSLKSWEKQIDYIEAGDADAAELHRAKHLETVANSILKPFGAKSVLDILGR